ncbi:response regulator [Bacteriovoracaceae bacterium]|nr:response regulator [Bacteriovoracaceae bacterium]
MAKKEKKEIEDIFLSALKEFSHLEHFKPLIESFANLLSEQLQDGENEKSKINLSSAVSAHIKMLYHEKFPKKCCSCGKIFPNREEYLKATEKLEKNNGIMVHERIGVQEYRNCTCGSTLVIVTSERRDYSEFGEAKRALFKICHSYYSNVVGKDPCDTLDLIRSIFKHSINDVISEEFVLNNSKEYDLDIEIEDFVTTEKKGRILLVDDDPDIISITGKMLNKIGYEFDSVEDGKKALLKMSNNKYILVLTDIMMPNMDGIELYNILKFQQQDETPILLMSGKKNVTDEINKIKGNVSFLKKPFTRKELDKSLEMTFERDEKKVHRSKG